jgi:hypothetical protein
MVWQVLQSRCHYEFRAKQTKLLIAKGVAPASSASSVAPASSASSSLAPASSSFHLPPTIVSEKVSHALLIGMAGAWPTIAWPCRAVLHGRVVPSCMTVSCRLAWPCRAVLHGRVVPSCMAVSCRLAWPCRAVLHGLHGRVLQATRCVRVWPSCMGVSCPLIDPGAVHVSHDLVCVHKVEKARKNNIPVKTLEELEQSVEELFVATPYSYSLSLSLSLAHSLSLTLAHSLTLSLTLFHTHTHTSSKP